MQMQGVLVVDSIFFERGEYVLTGVTEERQELEIDKMYVCSNILKVHSVQFCYLH